MKLRDIAALTTLLGRLSQDPKPDPRVRETLGINANGSATFDLYEPLQGAKRAAVALHGVTTNHRRDPRLIHFARSLALAGMACAVPSLPRLASCAWDPADLDTVEAVFHAVVARGLPSPGMIGFSYGGSYALVAATRPAIAQQVAFMLAFGPFHRLEELFDHYVATRHDVPTTDPQWDDLIYLHVVIAKQLRGKLSMANGLDDKVDDLLHRFCHDATLAEKREFFERHLRELELPLRALEHLDVPAMQAVSPAGKLQAIRCPVSLVHDTHDTMVPPSQSRRIYEELRAGSDVHKLLVTPLLQHVHLADAFRLGDVAQLFKALEPIVR